MATFDVHGDVLIKISREISIPINIQINIPIIRIMDIMAGTPMMTRAEDGKYYKSGAWPITVDTRVCSNYIYK